MAAGIGILFTPPPLWFTRRHFRSCLWTGFTRLHTKYEIRG